jgi:hypothetical protein
MTKAKLCVAGVLMAFAVCSTPRTAASTRGTNMPVNLRLEARQPVFSAGLAVIDFQVENVTAETVSVEDPGMPGAGQPRFTLTTPGGEKVSFVPRNGRHVRPSAPSPLIEIEPGASAGGDLELRDFADVNREGEYVLEATLEYAGTTVVAQSTKFRVESIEVQDVSAFSARSPEGEPSTGLVVLAGGRLGTVLVKEQDWRNGELFPLEVQLGPEAPGIKRTLGWYANYDISFDPARWLLAVSDTALIAATNLSSKTTTAPSGGPIDIWMNGLVVKGRALTVPVIARSGQGSELRLFTGSAQGGEPRLEPAKRIASFNGVARAAAATLSPDSARAVVIAAIPADQATRIVAWLIDEGAARASQEHRIDGVGAAQAAAVGWSSKGEIRVAVLGADAGGAVRIADVSLGQDLALRAPATVTTVPEISTAREATLRVVEQSQGTLVRGAVVRTTAAMVGINDKNQVRRPNLPAAGPYAMLWGRELWYVIWPEGARLRSASF